MATPAAPKAVAPEKANVVQDAYARILDSIAPNAAVLKQNYNSYLGRGLIIAAVIHLAAVGAYWGYVKATEVPPVEDIVLEQVTYADITPPAITDAPPPPNAAPPPPAAAAVASGTPTPVPDEEAPPKATIATQEEQRDAGPAVSGSGVGRVSTSRPGNGPVTATPPVIVPPVIVPPIVPPVIVPPVVPPVVVPPVVVPPAVLEFSEVSPVLIGGIERLQSGIQYPAMEQRARIEGRVIVRFIVGADGRTSDVQVVRAASPGLDRAAVQAVERARFEPGKQNGQAVAVRQTLPVTFRIAG